MDKLTNRYGGKGVISKILPVSEMPSFGNDHHVDIIYNMCTMTNRENPGQLFESCITFIGCQLIEYIASANASIDDSFKLILKYIELIAPEQAEDLKSTISIMDQDEKRFFLESIVRSGSIQLSSKPVSDSFDIDRLNKLYQAFPWIDQVQVTVPMKDSNGKLRYVYARRKMVIGKEYIFRLKQFAEEKFSATSLSATNIRGLNTKSKANKNYNELHSNTPIRFGNMEMNQMDHLGIETVIQALMIHSTSPRARRLAERLYTSNPYNINIQLDTECKNRSAEVVNTYLKVMGRRLVFRKIKKRVVMMPITPMYFTKPQVIKPIFFNREKDFDFEADYQERQKIETAKKEDKELVTPFYYNAVDIKRRKWQNEENKKAMENRKKSPRFRE